MHKDLAIGGNRYVSELVKKLCSTVPGPTDLPRMQQALDDFLGLDGANYRRELAKALKECWYVFAMDVDGEGWHHNGNTALVRIDELLGCKNKRHINHCCELGLRYQKDRKK